MLNINSLPEKELSEKEIIGLTLLDRTVPFQARDLSTSDFYNEFYKATWSVIL